MNGQDMLPDGAGHQDSLSSQELGVRSSEDGSSSTSIGEIPHPSSSPAPRPSSSLTVENLRLFEESAKRSATASPVLLHSTQDSLKTSSPLGPVKTGRGSPVRVGSAAAGVRSPVDLATPTGTDGESLRTGNNKPLPPIRGVNTDDDEEGHQAGKSGSSSTDDKTITSSNERLEPTSRLSQPRILSYRRELSLLNDEARCIQTSESVTRSERSVSFKDDSDIKDPPKSAEKRRRNSVKSPAMREEVRQRNADGTERIGVSIATETEWSWLESVALAGKVEVELQEADQTQTPPPSVSKRRHRKESQSTSSYISEDLDIGRRSREESFLEYETGDTQTESEYSDDDVAPLPTDTLIPSIGPPRIIQYQRESDRSIVYPDTPNNLANLAQSGMPPIPRFESFASSVSSSSDVEGVCEFCQQELKVFPTPEMVQTMTPEEMYCCPDYQELVEFTLTHSPEVKAEADELIDIRPHAPYGSKQARRAAKERAAQRMRDREMARQRAAGVNQANFYALQVARQMKTINYQLSSQKCLDEGWTIRPPTPTEENAEQPVVFQPEPVVPSNILPQKRQGINNPKMVWKYYKDGQLFMFLFPDGTGNVFYPSGHTAILITSHEKGQYTYLVYEDVSNNAQLLAIFEASGCATCYHSNGNIRLNLNEYGGIFADSKGAIKKKWNWKNQKDQTTHVHAPPFQPICFAINKVFSVRCMAQEQIFLAFNCNMQNVRFNVGVKLKLVAPQLIPREPIDDHALYLAEVRAYVELVLDKIHNIHKFSKSPKLDNLRPSLRLQHDILRNESLKIRRAMKYVTAAKPGKDSPVVTVN